MDLELIAKYIEPQLLILVPTLWGIGMAVKKSKIDNRFIPIILLVVACLISGMHLLSTKQVFDTRSLFSCMFASITQGCVIWLCAWVTYEKYLHGNRQ
ncbi:MAG: phage holin family protein [Oscillospiraceae bacterium]